MMRLSRGTVWHLVRSMGSVRRGWRPSIAGKFRGTGNDQKRQQRAQESSFNRERSLSPLTCHDIDFKIRSGIKNSPKRPSGLKKPESEFPIENVKLEDRDRGLPDLSPEEEAIFNSRLSKIWEGLMSFPKSELKDIASRSPEVWLSRIVQHIPTNVKSMLSSSQPPTLAGLKSLGWSDTTAGGVCLCFSKPNERSGSATETGYIYISSASMHGGGLAARRRSMLLGSHSNQDESLKSKVRSLDLKLEEGFITLFIVPFKDSSNDEVMNVRTLVRLVRAVLMIWLGAADEGLKPAIKDLVPRGLENIKYVGLVGDNPLVRNINRRDGAKKRKTHKGTK